MERIAQVLARQIAGGCAAGASTQSEGNTYDHANPKRDPRSAAAVGVSRAGRDGGGLGTGFRHPPAECRPEVFWDWMGGLLSKEGITKDVEALARAGVGGVMIMQMPDQLAEKTQWRFRDYPGKVKCLSDEWFDLMNHAAKETDRLGLRLSFLICPGWSHCGGPWIKPEQGVEDSSFLPHNGPRRHPI